jgi:hypothetical protein
MSLLRGTSSDRSGPPTRAGRSRLWPTLEGVCRAEVEVARDIDPAAAGGLAACRDRHVAAQRRAPVAEDRFDFQSRCGSGRLRSRGRNVEERRRGSSSDLPSPDQDAEQRPSDEKSDAPTEGGDSGSC